ncbi:MAG: type II toxin-antitoxin system RelE/ParE family toxin [Gammaproteobacteria bacterium]|nr:type II toxin-antitoxin system RelE/ParE family toxin [Gammaproteobacteria bacterium]
MANYKLTPAANADLKDIARYTERKWGREKRNQYLIALDSRFIWLGNNPEFGKRRDEINKGYLSYPEGRHEIFYRSVKNQIEILGILHQSMDYKQHL